jgi:23S rRNA (guanosine2251-2'-O)-methyltransferase
MEKLPVSALGRLTVQEFKNTKKYPFVVVLDDVRSLSNVGSVFRTCDVFLAEKLYLCGITGTPPDREIQKTALGATESVDWQYEKELETLIDTLQKEDWKIAVVEQATMATQLQDFSPEPEQKYAFVFGNEVFGVKESIVSKADLVLEVPQFGTKHSLNVAVCTGIVLWEFVRKKLKTG